MDLWTLFHFGLKIVTNLVLSENQKSREIKIKVIWHTQKNTNPKSLKTYPEDIL